MIKKNSIDCIHQLLATYSGTGLSLLFDDGRILRLTEDVVHAAARRLENDMSALPPEIRDEQDFKPCAVCPERDTAAMCHALPAIVPFLEELRDYNSFNEVTALFVEQSADGEYIMHLRRTTLQRALQYIAIQSVLYYCETGRLYYKYFSGVIPFTSAEDIAERIYANIMLEQNGDKAAVAGIIETMRENLMITMQCQIKRVRLVSHTDVFMNAFVNLHLVLELLAPEQRKIIRERLIQRAFPLD